MVGASAPSAGKGPCLERGDGNKCFSRNGQLGKGLGDFLLIPALPLGGPSSWDWHGGREIGSSWPCSALRFMCHTGSSTVGKSQMMVLEWGWW